MRITQLEPQARRPDRWNLALDGAFAFGLDSAVVVEYGLAVGQDLPPATVEQLRAAAADHDLYAAALRFLAPRPRSRAEVRRRLLRPRPVSPRATPALASRPPADPAAVERTLDRLASDGYLDDHDFASYWVDNRERFSPRGARALSAELRQRGVDRATVDAATEPVRDAERALAAGRQRLRALAGLDYRAFNDRLGPFLLRRGFGYEVARAAVRQLWAEFHGDQPSGDDDAGDDADTDGSFDE
jgi:regulatory protein